MVEWLVSRDDLMLVILVQVTSSEPQESISHKFNPPSYFCSRKRSAKALLFHQARCIPYRYRSAALFQVQLINR